MSALGLSSHFLPLALQLWSLCPKAFKPSAPVLWSVSLKVAEQQDSFKKCKKLYFGRAKLLYPGEQCGDKLTRGGREEREGNLIV